MQKDHTSASSGEAIERKIVELESSHWRLSLEPQTGLQTQSCQIKHRQAWHNLMPNCEPENSPSGTPLKASNFHMLPYSNRIRHGQFTHDKKNITLSDADNHAIHGALRKCAWRITEQAKHTVTAEYDTHIDGEVNWPWPVRATTSYTLTDNQLISQMTLTNLGSSSMPAGMGWHPYFCRSIDGAAPELRISVDGMYPDTNGDCLPTGAPIPLSKELDFSDSRKLDPTQRIDHCFAGFTSPATLHWPDAGIQIQMLASENCTHLVLYNPDEPYFAVEPVTNANDGFNLSEKGVASGVTILQPEQSLTAHMSLVLDIKCTD